MRIPEHVLLRSFGDEVVVLNLETGQYHGVTGAGGRMLEVLADVGDTRQAAVRVAEEYGRPESEVARDLDELCAELARRSLIELDEGAGRT